MPEHAAMGAGAQGSQAPTATLRLGVTCRLDLQPRESRQLRATAADGREFARAHAQAGAR